MNVVNCVMELARTDGRDYMTPEDVENALRNGVSPEVVRLAVLEVLGKKLGAEDYSLCAFIAWRGEAN